jgi:phenylacetate-CoA ligase
LSLIKEANLPMNDLKSFKNWSSIPFTTKEELRETHPLERSHCDLRACEYFFSSSGTYGEPTFYLWTKEDTTILQECGARAMKRVGIQEDDLVLVIARMGTSIMWYCMIQQYKSVGAGLVPLGARHPLEIIETLFRFPISVVISLPVIGTRLFEFLVSLQRTWPENSKFRHFHCGGDFLSESRRQRIEKLWNIKCYNFFGISEIFGPIAGECPQKDGLHFIDDYILIEVLDPETKEPVADGEVGVAVYTTLWEKGSPLLRYWSNDLVSINHSPCPCGDLSPRIKFIGRSTDMALINERRIYVSQLEDAVLSIPEVGNEYVLQLLGEKGRETANLIVETIPGAQIPINELSDRVSELLRCPVEIEVKPPAFLSRDDSKPKRIFDMRES